MSSVHQIYCTHCTYGNSALERRGGELAQQALGYSARASSTDAELLRRYYRKIERYMYYSLPGDSPSALRTTETALSAPRRLLFCPLEDNRDLLAQVCYRQQDATRQSYGSYFAHVLVAERSEARRDCTAAVEYLQLWGAPQWVLEDPTAQELRLSAYDSLSDWCGPDESERYDSNRPVIDDELLLRFLTCEHDGQFDAASDVIPHRLQQEEPSRRQAILEALLNMFIDVAEDERQSVLVVAEPGLAAMLFYSILRLIPPSVLRKEISFSTYESNPGRLCTKLAATVLHGQFYPQQLGDVEQKDLPPDIYRTKAVVSTFPPFRQSRNQQTTSRYARLAISLLVEKGWDAVKALLDDCKRAGVRTFHDLDIVADVHAIVPSLLGGSVPQAHRPWERSRVGAAYVRRFAIRCLSGPDGHERLSRLIKSDAHVVILELLVQGRSSPDLDTIIHKLCETLPDEQISQYLVNPNVPDGDKLAVLVCFVKQHDKLPPSKNIESLMPQLLIQLENETVRSYHRKLPDRADPRFFMHLTKACGLDAHQCGSLSEIVSSLDEDEFCKVIRGPAGASVLELLLEDESITTQRARIGRCFESDIVNKTPGSIQCYIDVFDVVYPHSLRIQRFTRAWMIVFSELDKLRMFAEKTRRLRLQKPTLRISPEVKGSVTSIAHEIEFAVTDVLVKEHHPLAERLRLLEPVARHHVANDEVFQSVWDTIRRVALPLALGDGDPGDLCTFLRTGNGKDLLSDYPKHEPILSTKLLEILNSLHDEPETIQGRVALLCDNKKFLLDGQHRLTEWTRLVERFEAIRDNNIGSGEQPQDKARSSGEDLLKRLDAALPKKQFKTVSPQQRLDLLFRLGQAVLGDVVDWRDKRKRLWRPLHEEILKGGKRVPRSLFWPILLTSLTLSVAVGAVLFWHGDFAILSTSTDTQTAVTRNQEGDGANPTDGGLSAHDPATDQTDGQSSPDSNNTSPLPHDSSDDNGTLRAGSAVNRPSLDIASQKSQTVSGKLTDGSLLLPAIARATGHRLLLNIDHISTKNSGKIKVHTKADTPLVAEVTIPDGMRIDVTIELCADGDDSAKKGAFAIRVQSKPPLEEIKRKRMGLEKSIKAIDSAFKVLSDEKRKLDGNKSNDYGAATEAIKTLCKITGEKQPSDVPVQLNKSTFQEFSNWVNRDKTGLAAQAKAKKHELSTEEQRCKREYKFLSDVRNGVLTGTVDRVVERKSRVPLLLLNADRSDASASESTKAENE